MDGDNRLFSLALVALGSNVPSAHGSPAQTVMRGIEALVSPETRIRTRSRLWQTPCMPVGAGPDYINAVVMLETTLEPQGLLDVLHRLEAAFDRARTGRWAARTLDLDLIDHDGAILPDSQTQAQWRALPPERQPIDAPDRLILPHPRLQDRGFVLIPLAEAAPVWHDPVSGRSVHDLIAALPAGVCDGMAPMPCRDGLSSVLP